MQWKKHALVVLMVSLSSLAQNVVTNPARQEPFPSPEAHSSAQTMQMGTSIQFPITTGLNIPLMT